MGIFTIFSDATNFDNTIRIPDAQFKMPSRIIYARHQVFSYKQRDDEKVIAFFQWLRILVECCQCTDFTVQQHKDIFFCNGLVSGLKSDGIGVRHLKLAVLEASLEQCISIANATKVTANFSRSFNASWEIPPSTSFPPVGNIAAAKKSTAQPYKALNNK